MANETHDAEHISVSPVVFYLLLGAVGLGGLGGGTALSPKLDQTALSACYDNSQTALDNASASLGLAKQHGKEFLHLRSYIDERTADRWTGHDQREFQREIDRHLGIVERRLDLLEARNK